MKAARARVAARIGTVPSAPFLALDLVAAAQSGSLDERFAHEDDALANLLAGDEFAASLYAFDLVQRRAKHPAGAPEGVEAKPVTKVGILGVGLMASQFALVFARRLGDPVVITDVSQERVDAGLTTTDAALLEKGRVSGDEATRIRALVSGSVDAETFADADWVIEAVFEERPVKQQVLAGIEKVVSPEAILATYTSSLSVTAMASVLQHPERLVGFHFFNQVAVMPLVEVVRAAATSDVAVATALSVAKSLQKTAIITADRTGFVVNRVLACVLGEAMRGVEEGTPFTVVAAGAAPLGLPMSPFELLELVGLPVGAHVLESHHAVWPERFFPGTGLRRLAEYGHILTCDKHGNTNGYDPGAMQLVAPAKKRSTRRVPWRCSVDSRLRLLTNSIACSTMVWSSMLRTSTSGSSSGLAIRSTRATSARISTVLVRRNVSSEARFIPRGSLDPIHASEPLVRSGARDGPEGPGATGPRWWVSAGASPSAPASR